MLQDQVEVVEAVVVVERNSRNPIVGFFHRDRAI
jgi:hypothetical protein